MAAAAAVPFVNLMDSEPAWLTIMDNFGLSVQSRNRLSEDYSTARDLMTSNAEQIKSVISTQNKIYRNHPTVNQRCHINTAQLNRTLAFYRWTVFTIKDAEAEYDDASAAAFDMGWINSVVDEYLIPDPIPTSQSTSFAVAIPRFEATNWHDVKTKLIALLVTRIGNAGLPLTYLTRSSRVLWEDTDAMTNLQERRIRTKTHVGITFEKDNAEFFRILMMVFTSTTLDNVVKSFQATTNGIGAW